MEEESKYIYRSSFTMKYDKQSQKVYCGLTETRLIIFKTKVDKISLKQILLDETTRCEYKKNQNNFSVTRGIFTFTFTSEDAILVHMWANKIIELIQNNKSSDPVDNCNSTEVNIDQFGKVYIMLRNNDPKLYIYESLDHHHNDIVNHTIDLKFHTITKLNRQNQAQPIVLKGTETTYKINFKDESLVNEWREKINKTINASIYSDEALILDEIYKNESNRFCADCGSPKPEWVSTNLSIVVCINCSGIHRGLGTCYSRIQSAIIDERIWEDGRLIKLLHEIGNDKSNSFWLHKKPAYNISYKDPIFCKDKYVKKLFIDSEFSNLSENELKDQLKLSVTKSDVFQTLKLWKSTSFNYNQEFTEELLKIARDSNQPLQEKFISLQPRNSKIEIDTPTKLFESALQLSYNDRNKLDSVFLVSLSTTSISIRTEKSNMVCRIPYDNICLLWNDEENKKLLISIDLSVEFKKFKKSNNEFSFKSVNKINLFNQTQNVLRNFLLELLKVLIPNNLEPFSEKSNLFMNITVKIDSEVKSKCKSYLTEHKIIFDSPISVIYDIKTSKNIMMINEDTTVCIVYNTHQLYLMTNNNENQKLIFNCLKNSAKGFKLDIVPIDVMVSFIRNNGLESEGIFRQPERMKKVNDICCLIEKYYPEFRIDPKIYSVHDVASCLKKYCRSLPDCLIPDFLFELFHKASKSENDEEKIRRYKNLLSFLPDLNYMAIRKILELFYTIQKSSSSNKMDSKSLAISTSLSIICFDDTNFQISSMILQDFIDHFPSIFDDAVEKFPTDYLTFCIHQLLINKLKLKPNDYLKLKFFNRDNKFFMVRSNVKNLKSITDIIEQLFNDPQIELWHFYNKTGSGNKTLKSLIFLNENIKLISNQKRFSNYTGYFVFLPKESPVVFTEKNIFQVDVKIKMEYYDDYNLYIMFPNTFQLYEKKSKDNNPVFNLKLSKICLYQYHHKKCHDVLIFDDETKLQLKCRFLSYSDYQEFLSFFRKCRSA